MSGHTKGPWTARPAPYGFDIVVLDKPTERALWVASVTTPIAEETPFYPSREECKANVRLISHAPELVDSLYEMLDPYEGMEPADLFAKLPGTEAQRVVRARAVLQSASSYLFNVRRSSE